MICRVVGKLERLSILPNINILLSLKSQLSTIPEKIKQQIIRYKNRTDPIQLYEVRSSFLNYLIKKSSGRCFNVFVAGIVLTIIEQRNKEK